MDRTPRVISSRSAGPCRCPARSFSDTSFFFWELNSSDACLWYACTLSLACECYVYSKNAKSLSGRNIYLTSAKSTWRSRWFVACRSCLIVRSPPLPNCTIRLHWSIGMVCSRLGLCCLLCVGKGPRHCLRCLCEFASAYAWSLPLCAHEW